MSTLQDEVIHAREALVRVNGKDAAFLTMLATDEYRLQYLESYLDEIPQPPPISLALPLQKKPYISEGSLHPFFDNLLFEGEQLRLAEKQFGLNRRSVVDRFKLLLLTGHNTLSPVSILPMIRGEALVVDAAADPLENTRTYRLEPGYKESCSICLKISPKGDHASCRKLLWGSQRSIHMEAFSEDPLNIFRSLYLGQSISGAQRKALFSLGADKTLRRQGFPHYIIKPDGDFPEMPANEHLSMAIASELDFRVPPIGLFRIEGIGFICVIKRFDWNKKTGCQFTEDFAQINQELAEKKDQARLEAIVNSIRRFTDSPTIELAEFFRRLLFCFVIGNGDMHLKNWSLSRDEKSRLIKLAPLYDYLNVRACYPQEQVETVLPMNGKQKGLTGDDFKNFGQAIGLQENYIRNSFAQIPAWERVIKDFCSRSALTEKLRNRYQSVVHQRVAALLR